MSKEKTVTKVKVKKRPGKLPTFAFISIAIFVVGLVLSILAAVLLKGDENTQLRTTLIYVGLGILGVGVICIIIAIAIYRYYDRHPELQQPISERIIMRDGDRPSIQPDEQSPNEQLAFAPQTEPEAMPDAVANLDTPVTYVGGNVTYIPSMEAYEFINMGRYQTLDEKFDQISKMDHTQFVIYVARLFSRKGYQVKLTPVVDNYDIDIIVEKMGVTIAVGCLLTNKVLCKEDITCVRYGKDRYHVNNCMALTNMYFDRSALEYAREEKMSLVDRNILAEDFMN